jgi:hypothetical protein
MNAFFECATNRKKPAIASLALKAGYVTGIVFSRRFSHFGILVAQPDTA